MSAVTRKHGSTWARTVIAGTVIGVVALSVLGGMALATPTSGLGATPLGGGNLENPIRLKFKDGEGFGDGVAVERIQMTRFELAPGGTFGWHQHGGPVWVVVTQGTLTLHSGDEGCAVKTVGPGGAFMDHGNNTHEAVNLGTEPVVVYATFMLPAGGAARVDVPDPGVCS